MITVHARVFATLRRYQPELKIGEALPVNLSDGATVERLIRQLGLPRRQPLCHVKAVFVNGIIRLEDHVLSDGDEVGIFPPVGGG
jgi:molybdopterin converting factor small subunit